MPKSINLVGAKRGLQQYRLLLTELAQQQDEWDRVMMLSSGTVWRVHDFNEQFPSLTTNVIPFDDMAMHLGARYVLNYKISLNYTTFAFFPFYS